MHGLSQLDAKASAKFRTEPEVSAYADRWLRELGFELKHTKTNNPKIDRCWPSKTAAAKGEGLPDLLVYLSGNAELPFCVWENKAPKVDVEVALAEAKGYVAGVHAKLAGTPGLPRLAVGFNGHALRLAYYNHEAKWVEVKANGAVVVDAFPRPEHAVNGLSATGTFHAVSGMITRGQLRSALPKLKTLYRSIPVLAAGRRPIDFTVALLTLKMLVESRSDWGSWAEQPALVTDAKTSEQAISERFKLLVRRVMDDRALKGKYGDIFEFREKIHDEPVAFNFLETLQLIDTSSSFFERMFEILDELAPLHGAEFDLFGEVYQAIGDDATKKALGEFFTGRHIIAAMVPVLLERAGVRNFKLHLDGKSIADIACGTGGFLTETLRYIRRTFGLDDDATRAFAEDAFYGYDLSPANASRARVNMYFAGDGFSVIEGNVDSLAPPYPDVGPFDYILTNPPYGSSTRYHRLEEAFLERVSGLLEPGSGWGLIVLPTGVLENPRSAAARLKLLRAARVTDVISLPMHAFAPYTKQRTAVVILQRRATPRAETAWPALISAIGHEKVNLFVVDNDGFANSDKRYETARTLPSGQWCHDDLSPWTDTEGVLHPGKLFAALIQHQVPGPSEDEFGTALGSKYGVLSLKELHERAAVGHAGVSLLPDHHLRPRFETVAPSQFLARTQQLIKEATGQAPTDAGMIRERAKALLATRVEQRRGKKPAATQSVDEAFVIAKGDTGLTEAVIYNQFDSKGLPVYGGGESTPRFFISSRSSNKHGTPLRVHRGPALIVSLDGSSGAVRVVRGGKFVLNHHGCVLKPRPGIDIDLHYAAQQIEGGLRGLAANTDASATLTLPKLRGYRFQLPSDAFNRQAIAEARAELEAIRDRFA